LAEVTVYLALAPKSNAAYLGINEAQRDIREGRIGEVPPHLRDAHYPGAQSLGHGEGYAYPHDDAAGIVSQAYAPDPIADAQYYRPVGRGLERELQERSRHIREILRGQQD
jgi:putative ATPase